MGLADMDLQDPKDVIEAVKLPIEHGIFIEKKLTNMLF